MELTWETLEEGREGGREEEGRREGGRGEGGRREETGKWKRKN